MKKYLSVLLVIILLVSNFSVTIFAQESDDTVTFYFDCPEGFTNNDTVVCSILSGYDTSKIYGELIGNGLYKFTIPNFSMYGAMSFNNDGIVMTDNDYCYEESFRTTITFFIDEGKIYLDRNYTIEGSPNNLVLTNQIYYQSTDLGYINQYYAMGEWLTLSQWHRSDLFNKYLEEQGARYPEILDEEQAFNLWYMYDELYVQNDDNDELVYSLVFGATPDKTEQDVYEVYGDYVLRHSESYSPDTFGYYIYLSETDNYVTLKEAVELNVPDIEEVFSIYGLGELIGDVDVDGILSVLDATKIQRCLVELDEFNKNDEVIGNSSSEMVVYISDFNKDGKRNIFDATEIQRKVAGVVNEF